MSGPAVSHAEAKAAAVAAEHAATVDRQAEFPTASIAALADAGLLHAAVTGHRTTDLAGIATRLARSCGSTALVWAMHQIQLACLARHGGEAALGRVLAGPNLIASVTSEVGVGGDLRRSDCAVRPSGEGVAHVEKKATTVSYAEHAGAFLITARRDPLAAPADQVAVLVHRDQAELTDIGTWNPMGMRGTRSPGAVVRGVFTPDQILPAPFPEIAESTMLPLSHILWSAVWIGLATEALERARRHLRRGRPDLRANTDGVVRADARLRGLTAHLACAIESYSSTDPGEPVPFSSTAAFNALKLSASEDSVTIALAALAACGMAGYSEDGPHSVARIVRDLHSSGLMVANARLLETNGRLLPVLGRR